MTRFFTRSSRTGSSCGGSLARRGRRFLLPVACELEGRTLLSTLMVTNDQQSGAGSLTQEVALAGSGGTIKFSPAWQARRSI